VSAFSSVCRKGRSSLSGDFALLSQLDNPEAPSLLAAAGFGVVIYNVKGMRCRPPPGTGTGESGGPGRTWPGREKR